MGSLSLPSKVHLTAGVALLAGGLIYLSIWAISFESLSGPVSLRKPILFCLASGVTCLSLSWIAKILQPMRGDTLLAIAFSLSIVGEVGLICLQQWRGVPSHFNVATNFDSAVLLSLKVLVTIMTLAIAVYTVRSLKPLKVDPDYAYTARAGMLLLTVSCLLGFLIEFQGEAIASIGGDPSTYSPAGVLKFPHGVPMHAIQYLPLSIFGLRWLGIAEPIRSHFARSLAGGTIGFTCFALFQTYTGRMRFDLTTFSTAILIMSIAVCFAWIPRALLDRTNSEGQREIHSQTD